MGTLKDLTGQRFGKLTVVGIGSRASNGSIKWLCQCDCDENSKVCVRGDALKSGRTVSCGCFNREKAKCNLEGQRFGHLTVIKEEGRSKDGDVLWLCKCDCTNDHIVKTTDLTHGHVKSCGCLKSKMISDANKIHGMYKTKLYSIWGSMKTRCYNPHNREYNNYGERGIEVCEEWKNDFTNFYNWAISHGFKDDLTIDRIDNNKGYSPDNCRWITNLEQQRNKRRTRYVTYKGETKPLTEWSEILGINYNTLVGRIYTRNWSIEKAFNTPVKSNKNH